MMLTMLGFFIQLSNQRHLKCKPSNENTINVQHKQLMIVLGNNIPLGHLALLIMLKRLYLKFSSRPFPVSRHNISPALGFDSRKIAKPLVTAE